MASSRELIHLSLRDNGAFETKKMPTGVACQVLTDACGIRKFHNAIPSTVRDLLESKGALPLYSEFAANVIDQRSFRRKSYHWRGVHEVADAFNKRFEKFGVRLHHCQVRRDGVLSSWFEFVDLKLQSSYEPTEVYRPAQDPQRLAYYVSRVARLSRSTEN
mmetsp:Transcript_44969/g.106802  ORF Transcript_44969/g.106802 Transcript_44969/m.106802 type:complete len:161 (+) Transcript_44969:86-568(+)|eukprot:CAMPEP_0178411148 /NCGR_PEP_ID=MMETSP0689_2-20121128/21346_1 /TAXON_ID=160604 /ORGANISM="Amphidinium massartii, Strain CS-259" /LENGTH=160 /DNA_ID=CAMNT_0020032347 /DNA_START=85 /DNA_END=567 /DNA_ORIENTATION=+